MEFFNFFFDTWVHENLKKKIIADQRRPVQTWSIRLPTVIFLISIIILGYYKLLQSTSHTFFFNFVNFKKQQSRIFKLFFYIHVPGYMKILIFFSAQTSADLVKKALNNNSLNLYHHFRIL